MYLYSLRDVEETVTALRTFNRPGTGQLYEHHGWMYNPVASSDFVTQIEIREKVELVSHEVNGYNCNCVTQAEKYVILVSHKSQVQVQYYSKGVTCKCHALVIIIKYLSKV